MSTNQSQLATAALETLHGARALPAAEAAAKLFRDFVDSIATILPPTARLADASGALKTLVHQLEATSTADRRRFTGIRDRNDAQFCQQVRLILEARHVPAGHATMHSATKYGLRKSDVTQTIQSIGSS